ncbi:MAG: imidazole glycerol phosphate synthase subunit HisH [Ruminococcaceae bacterium]|nr:imidazole glycerol phosphate synthase subunit HisH [Oscillospiraceae bacterium]
MIAIIDYGAGNVHSVQKALSYIGCETVITADPAVIGKADGVILPGVGAFGDAMHSLTASGLDTVAKEYIASGRPFLGICLGLQVLFERSEETPDVDGLSVFGGEIVKIPSDGGLKVPQIGWNALDCNKDCPLFDGLPENPYVYFVHSYYLKAADPSVVAATTRYGVEIHAAAWRGNCFAVQFHPEKSGDVGLAMLRNFRKLVEN